jgi:hypothetical protein
MGRSSRLKRRTGNRSNGGFTITLDDDEANTEQPPLKKFKALFEASDPSRMGMQGLTTATAEYLQTQGQTLAPGSFTQENCGVDVCNDPVSFDTHRLVTVTEQDEEESTGTPEPSRRTKRRADEMMQDIVDVDPVQESRQNKVMRPTPTQSPPRKKFMTSGSQANDHVPVKPSSGSQTVSGASSAMELQKGPSEAEARKPDMDEAFLQALASTKRGKRHEDEFDRDFNNLRISKPDINRRESEQEWKIVEDFGDETNIRGNFMVIVELEVPRERNKSRALVIREEWQGAPNFKKFRRVSLI